MQRVLPFPISYIQTSHFWHFLYQYDLNKMRGKRKNKSWEKLISQWLEDNKTTSKERFFKQHQAEIIRNNNNLRYLKELKEK